MDWKLVYKKGIFKVYEFYGYRVYWTDNYGEHFDILFNNLENAKMYVDSWSEVF